eukprot:SAG31_NODE_949_length_10824_cov_2.835338_3_plen_328_part_00
MERRPIERVELLPGGVAYALRNVLSPAECAWLVQQAELPEARRSMSEIGSNDRLSYRICSRLQLEGHDLARELFERIRPTLLRPEQRAEILLDAGGKAAAGSAAEATAVPAIVVAAEDEKRERGLQADLQAGTWEAVGLNEMFRLCLYRPGGRFQPHIDGGRIREPTERSIQTFMLYLSAKKSSANPSTSATVELGPDVVESGFEGGSTRFYSEEQQTYEEPDPRLEEAAWQPEVGSAVVFNHNIIHDGEPVTAGRKYIFRSEIMYHQSAGDRRARPKRPWDAPPEAFDFDKGEGREGQPPLKRWAKLWLMPAIAVALACSCYGWAS